MSPNSNARHLGGGLYIDIESGSLSMNDQLLGLGPQLESVLKFLYQRMSENPIAYTATEVVRKGAWPNTSVEPASVHQAVRAIRRRIGDADLKKIIWIENKPYKGYRLICKHPDALTSSSGFPPEALPQANVDRALSDGVGRLPAALRTRIDDLKVSPAITLALVRVLTSDNYPAVMTLSNDPVINPIWGFISPTDRSRLSSTFSPFGALPPRIMHLDIFLLKSNDKSGRPYLLNYFSGKPVSGWQAFMLPFRHRKPGEDEDLRQRENAKDIASFIEVDPKIVKVESLGGQFVVSVKPDPGYSELVVYIFEFCSVRMDSAPRWMRHIDCELKLQNYVRRFRWCHPEELEKPDRSELVDGDVIRGVHYFFFTTLPSVPVGFPVALPT
jgi:DNA-binding winged helix-turn-helix (wHTH) protein